MMAKLCEALGGSSEDQAIAGVPKRLAGSGGGGPELTTAVGTYSAGDGEGMPTSTPHFGVPGHAPEPPTPTVPENILGGVSPNIGGSVDGMTMERGSGGGGGLDFAVAASAAGSMAALGAASATGAGIAANVVSGVDGVVGDANMISKAASRGGARKRRAAAAAAAAHARDATAMKTVETDTTAEGGAHRASAPALLVAPAALGGGILKTPSAPPSENGGGSKSTGQGRGGRRRRRGSAAARSARGATGDAKPEGLEVGNKGLEDEEAGTLLDGRDVEHGRAEDVCEEDDEGNVEYKLKLVDPPLDRLEHLFTQMNWRLNEGRGECMYMLGYEDDGKATGISPSELSASIKTLRVMMEAVGAKIENMQVQAGAGGGKLRVARVTVVRQAAVLDGLPPGSERRGLRVGVLGHAGAGKSTLVGVLTRGLSDNGRGLARMQVFRHNHEVFNGQTSSISQQALTLPLAHRETISNARCSAGGGRNVAGGSGSLHLGTKQPGVARDAEESRLSSSFPRSSRLGGASASNGFASAWARGRCRGDSLDDTGGRVSRVGGTASDGEKESRVLTFIDQPGHEKYLKTTLTGMTGSALDYAMLVVSGVGGVQRMTREHLAIALALQLPLFVVMTKSDVAGSLPPGISSASPPPAQHSSMAQPPLTAMELALQSLDRVLWASMGKRSKIVAGVEGAEGAADALRGGSGAVGMSWDGLVPIIQVSSVTADGFAELRAFLGRLSPPEPLEAMYKEARGKATEVRISNTFMVEGVGEVYAGTVVSGTVSVGDHLLLGPTGANGAFLRTAVASVHVSRLAVRCASAGQTASFTLVADPEDDSDDSDPDPSTPPGFVEKHGDAGTAIGGGGGVFVRVAGEGGGLGSDTGDATTAGGAVPEITFVTPNDPSPRNGSRNDPGGIPDRSGGGNSSDSGGSWNDGPGVTEDSEATLRMDDDGAGDTSGHDGSNGKGEDSDACGNGGASGTVRTSPLLFDSGVGGAGEGDSPGKRTRKGMVLVEATSRPNTSYEFEAEVMILHHPRVIRENYQPVVHAHNICQSARITSMVRSSTAAATGVSDRDDGVSKGIKSGERAVCRFRFLYRPEYLSAGTTIVLREGRTRGFGKVISVN